MTRFLPEKEAVLCLENGLRCWKATGSGNPGKDTPPVIYREQRKNIPCKFPFDSPVAAAGECGNFQGPPGGTALPEGQGGDKVTDDQRMIVNEYCEYLEMNGYKERGIEEARRTIEKVFFYFKHYLKLFN